MVEALAWSPEEQADQLFIHFDVKAHQLGLDTFIQTAASVQKIVKALDKTLFRGGSEFEIIVLPPSEGTFVEWLGIHPKKKLTAAVIFTFLASPPGEAFTKGLTGQTTSEWFEDSGALLGEGITVSWQAFMAMNGIGVNSATSIPVSEAESEVACIAATRIVTSMTRNILELGTDVLNKIGVDFGDLPDAMDARAEFYEACLKDAEVKRIGFTPDDNFPIPRNSFPERAQKPARKKKDDEPEWVVSEEAIRVDSPTWDQDKQRSRQWLGVDQNKRNRYFVIEDAEFWLRLRKKELHFEGLDQLKVQWAYQIVSGKVKNRRVLRVLEFNGSKLAEPLSRDAINAILGNYATLETSREGPSLLDFLEDL